MSAPATPFVESHFWHKLDGLRTIQIKELAGLIALTLDASYEVGQALSTWEALANASPSLVGAYVFTQNATSFRFTRTDGGGGPSGAGTFDLVLQDSLHTALGFAASVQTGAGNYSSDSIPLCQVQPLGIDYSAPTRDHQVRSKIYRWGRVVTHRFNASKLLDVRVHLPTGVAGVLGHDAITLLDGPLFSSRLRLHCANPSNEYPTLPNFEGYFDLDPYGFNRRPQMWGNDVYTTIFIKAIIRGAA